MPKKKVIMKINIDTITEKEAEHRGFIDPSFGYINTLQAEYGDPTQFLNDLDQELRTRKLRLVGIDDGGSDYHLFIDNEDGEENRDIERHWQNTIQNLRKEVEFLISELKKGETKVMLKKQKANGIIWDIGETGASRGCEHHFLQEIYEIICNAEKHGIILNYGNTDRTVVKDYFKSLLERN